MPRTVRHIAEAVRPFPFERLYAAFGRPVETDANGAVQRSAERYIRHISGGAIGPFGDDRVRARAACGRPGECNSPVL